MCWCSSGLGGSRALQVLQLSYNQISTLEAGDLEGLHQLKELHLQHNLISSLHPRAFVGLTNLTVRGGLLWDKR